MKVRLALPDDEDAVIDLARQDVAETLPHLTFREDITRATFRQYLAEADPTIFVVEHRGEVVGFLMALMQGYAFTDGVFATGEVIYVRPDRRGTLAAAHLVRAFVEWAETIEAREAIMGVSNGLKMERTARFLERFGFKVVGTFGKRVIRG